MINPIEALRKEKLERFYRNVGYYAIAFAMSLAGIFAFWIFMVLIFVGFPEYNQ